MRSSWGWSPVISDLEKALIDLDGTLAIPREVFMQASRDAFELLDSVGTRNVNRVFPHQLFCSETDDGLCHFMNKDYFYLVDKSHPTLSMSNKIVDHIFEQLFESGWIAPSVAISQSR